MYDDMNEISRMSTFDEFGRNSLTPVQGKAGYDGASSRRRMGKLYKCQLPNYRMFCRVFYPYQDKQRKRYKYNKNSVSGRKVQKRKGLTASVSFQNEIEYGQRKPNKIQHDRNLIPQKRNRKSAINVRV